MSYSVIAPFATPISVVGNSFPEAVKNFVKLQKDITLNQFIITDQINNMHAYVEYINKQKGGRSRRNARIRMKHTYDRFIHNYQYPNPMGVMGVPASGPVGMVTGFPINGPAAGMPPGYLYVPPDSSRTSVETLTAAILNNTSEEIVKRAVMYASNSAKNNIRSAITGTSATVSTAVYPIPSGTPTIDARNLRDLLNKIGLTELTNIISVINPTIRKCIDNALNQQIVVPFGGVPMGMPMGVPVNVNGVPVNSIPPNSFPVYGGQMRLPYGISPPPLGWRPAP